MNGKCVKGIVTIQLRLLSISSTLMGYQLQQNSSLTRFHCLKLTLIINVNVNQIRSRAGRISVLLKINVYKSARGIDGSSNIIIFNFNSITRAVT
jgi:hypothetical protein